MECHHPRTFVFLPLLFFLTTTAPMYPDACHWTERENWPKNTPHWAIPVLLRGLWCRSVILLLRERNHMTDVPFHMGFFFQPVEGDTVVKFYPEQYFLPLKNLNFEWSFCSFPRKICTMSLPPLWQSKIPHVHLSQVLWWMFSKRQLNLIMVLPLFLREEHVLGTQN